MFRAGLIAVLAMLLIAAAPIPPLQSHGPTPSSGGHAGQPQADPASAQAKADNGGAGTDNKPLFVQLKDSQEQKDEAAKHASYEKKEATNNRLIAIFTVVLGVVGLIEIIILGLQIYWMRRTVLDSSEQYARTERAYIVPGTFNREISTEADRMPPTYQFSIREAAELSVTYFAVQPVWTNTGSTPTESMRIQVDWSDGEDRPVGSYRREWQRFFVAPKSSETSEFIEMPGLGALIRGGAVGTVVQMPLRLIWGIAEYDDVFGKKHSLRWCYRIRPSRPVPGEGIKISFIQWGDYNASNDETD